MHMKVALQFSKLNLLLLIIFANMIGILIGFFMNTLLTKQHKANVKSISQCGNPKAAFHVLKFIDKDKKIYFAGVKVIGNNLCAYIYKSESGYMPVFYIGGYYLVGLAFNKYFELFNIKGYTPANPIPKMHGETSYENSK